MGKFLIILLLLLPPVYSRAQRNLYFEEWNPTQLDSIRLTWNNPANDTVKMAAARSLGMYYQERNRDSSLYFNEAQAMLARKLNQRLWEADALDNFGFVLGQLKNYPRSLHSFLSGLKILQDKETEKNIWRITIFAADGNPHVARMSSLAYILSDMGRLFEGTGNTQDAFSNFRQAIQIGEELKNNTLLTLVNMNLSAAYLNLGKLDSATFFLDRTFHYSRRSGFKKYMGYMFALTGSIQLKKGNYALAKQHFSEAIEASWQQNNYTDLAHASLKLAEVLHITGDLDASLRYAKQGQEIAQAAGSPDMVAEAYTAISATYIQRKNADSAIIYQGLSMALKDSINNIEKIKQFQAIGFDEQVREQEAEKERLKLKNKIRTYVMLSGIAVFMLITFLLYRNIRIRKKANALLQQQNEEIANQKKNVEQTLATLRSTQAQLIHSEKMASLGELTAGIAHEIQNPLNFVNNFSEVNKELLAELQSAMDKGNQADVMAIANDIIGNEEKIIFHGKRADSIVKSMLQHSQKGNSVKEPTDINKLADEYFRLAYHGLRAKDKSFCVTLNTDFDESIGTINIIQQDIGRVILNMVNNAFYAVNEKFSSTTAPVDSLPKEGPTVSIGTKKIGNKVEIRIKDNGNGIPPKILEKVFHPFFTTKPSGKGTGLGLSLSYDIIKAHGGDIIINTSEGEFTQFVIRLPV